MMSRAASERCTVLVCAVWDRVNESKQDAARRYGPAGPATFRDWLENIAARVLERSPDKPERNWLTTQVLDSLESDQAIIADFYGDDSALQDLEARHAPRIAAFFQERLGFTRDDLVERIWRRVADSKFQAEARFGATEQSFTKWLDEIADDVLHGDWLFRYYSHCQKEFCPDCESAFNLVYERYGPELFRDPLGNPLRLDKADRLDCLQQVFLEVTKTKRDQAGRYSRDDGSLKGWLRRRTLWRGKDCIRRKIRDRILVPIEAPAANGLRLLDELSDPEERPLDRVLSDDERRHLDNCCARLPGQERRVFSAIEKGVPRKEIQAELNLSAAGISYVYQRAKRKVCRWMREKDYYYPYVYPEKLN
jgi:RNA polymerase sigma factor (sigma-70 family)